MGNIGEKAQAGWGVAQEKTGQVGQSIMGTAQAGKDNTGGFLLQTGETIKGAAVGASEAVKNTFGVGQTDENKK